MTDSLSPRSSSIVIAFAVGLTIAVAHTLAAWGHVGALGGDTMRWLHEVERYASGQRPYADFFWIFPPLSMWVYGGVARVFGADAVVVWILSASIYVATVIAFVSYARRLVDHEVLPLTVAVGVTLATALAHNLSSPLPVGMYTPALPVGGLLLMVAMVGTLTLRETVSARAIVTVGVASAGCVLAKQDFWLPAAVLIFVSVHRIIRSGAPASARNRAFALLSLACCVPLVLAIGILVTQNDPGVLTRIATGFGAAGYGMSRIVPGLERLVLQVGVMATLMATVSALLWFDPGNRTRVSVALGVFSLVAIGAFALWIAMAVRIGATGAMIPTELQSPLQLSMSNVPDLPAGRILRAGLTLADQVVQHALPAILPLFMLTVTLVRRSRWRAAGVPVGTLITILTVCVAARVRRGFEYTEWYHVMLEVPALVVFGHALLSRSGVSANRATRRLLVILLAGAGVAYWHMGTGNFTKRGRGVAVNTARGHVWLTPARARDFLALRGVIDSLDPSGRRPLYVMRRSVTHNYFLGRPSVGPLTHGFQYSLGLNLDSVVVAMAASTPPLFILQHPDLARSTPIPSSYLTWERWPVSNASPDIALIQRMRSLCQRTTTPRSIDVAGYQLTDCSVR